MNDEMLIHCGHSACVRSSLFIYRSLFVYKSQVAEKQAEFMSSFIRCHGFIHGLDWSKLVKWICKVVITPILPFNSFLSALFECSFLVWMSDWAIDIYFEGIYIFTLFRPRIWGKNWKWILFIYGTKCSSLCRNYIAFQIKNGQIMHPETCSWWHRNAFFAIIEYLC